MRNALEVPLLFENVFGESERKTVYAAYALTVTVKDAITGKPVADASVKADTTEIATDNLGQAIFTSLAQGTYTIEVTNPSYKSTSTKVTLTEAGQAIEIKLWPYWIIGAGIVGGLALLTLAATKAAKWW